MKKAIKVKPSDIVIVCAPGCNCDRKRAKTTTNLADLMEVGMPICPECGEDTNLVRVEVHLEET
jgi:hypothetical protein